MVLNNINKLEKSFSSISLDNVLLSDYLDLINNENLVENDINMGPSNYVRTWSPYKRTIGCNNRS